MGDTYSRHDATNEEEEISYSSWDSSRTELIGEKFNGWNQWHALVTGNDGFLYAMPAYENRVLQIDPSDDYIGSYSIENTKGSTFWHGCITGHDGCIYAKGCDEILKYNPTTEEEEIILLTKNAAEENSNASYSVSSAVAPNGIIYYFPLVGKSKILRFDPADKSTSLIGDDLPGRSDEFWWRGAVTAGDGCIYVMPMNATSVLRFDPTDESTTFICDESSSFVGKSKWWNGVLGADGNIYGVPCDHHKILKINVDTQSLSLVGPDLGGPDQRNPDQGKFKYINGVLGLDHCIYMIPHCVKFVLKFNPVTGTTSAVGKSLGLKDRKYNGGVLASNGYIYAPPSGAEQVLKIKSWDIWIYLKYRLLVEQRRATRQVIKLNDDDLDIAQHFIINVNDDIFRLVLEML